jgi:hypothetical protein
MAGASIQDNAQSLVPFDVATVEKVHHFMETISPFPGCKHGLAKV